MKRNWVKDIKDVRDEDRRDTERDGVGGRMEGEKDEKEIKVFYGHLSSQREAYLLAYSTQSPYQSS